MTDQILEWATHYRINNMDVPDRVALKAVELKELKADLSAVEEGCRLPGVKPLKLIPDTGPIMIFGLIVNEVADDYDGPRVWKRAVCKACNGSGLADGAAC
jgi:hypothetical protein